MAQSTPHKSMNWDDYERGHSSRHGSLQSETSHLRFDDPSPSATSKKLNVPGTRSSHEQSGQTLHHKRSSFSTRVSSLAHAGGANSFDSFARSWQRAAAFAEIPHQRSLLAAPEDDDANDRRDSETPKNNSPYKSLLREQLEQSKDSSNALLDDQSTSTSPGDVKAGRSPSPVPRLEHSGSDIFNHSSYHNSPFGSQYGGIYGSMVSRIGDTPRRVARVSSKTQEGEADEDFEREEPPLLTKVVEREDGKYVEIAIGQSTMPQTVFNSVNILIGVGVLSLPLALKYSGLLIGIAFLLCAALATRYTARLLAKCLDVDDSLITFADLAYVSFGTKARVCTSLLFTLELLGTCVALVILFADSLAALIPSLDVTGWKLLCGLILIPLSFAPLRLLSFTSVLGIISCSGLVILVIIDGLVKSKQPGSLTTPATQHLFPRDWSMLPLSFGLLMAPWGGHSVFPNIYRDMRHSYRYTKALNITFSFSYILDLSMAVVGLLMFGDEVLDEITSNILVTKGYPRALSVCIIVFIAIIPLTKIPLNVRPIFVTIETLAGLTSRTHNPHSYAAKLSCFSRALLKGTIRISLMIIIVFLAIVVPSFDVIMGLLGSAMCFTICIILPLAFYIKIFGHEIRGQELVLDWFLIVVCSVMAVVGTVWCCLPRDMICGNG